MREVEVTVEPRNVFQRGARLPGGAHNNSLMTKAVDPADGQAARIINY